MPQSARMDLRRRSVITVVLAAVVLLVPPLLLRSGPESWRHWLRGVQHGSLSGLGGSSRFLRFPTQYRQMGELRRGRVAIEFPFHNRADGPVRLERTWSSCGCSQVMVPTELIAPGAAGKVVMHVDTTDQLPGSFWLLAKVFTDREPDQPFLLIVEGEVK